MPFKFIKEVPLSIRSSNSRLTICWDSVLTFPDLVNSGRIFDGNASIMSLIMNCWIICRVLTIKQYEKNMVMATGAPNINIGNMATRNEENATANISPNTVIALTAINRKELDTKAAKTRKGRKAGTIKIATSIEISGWVCVNSLVCLTVRTTW